MLWLALPHLPEDGMLAADVVTVELLDALLDAAATRPAFRLSVSKPALRSMINSDGLWEMDSSHAKPHRQLALIPIG
jgi:hypothetical protein